MAKKKVLPFKTIKGDKARRAKHIDTGEIISRRQFNKKRREYNVYKQKTVLQTKLFKNKYDQYKSLRDDFIREQKARGIKRGKREVMQSPDFQNVVKELKLKPKKGKKLTREQAEMKARALVEIGRIREERVEEYIRKFSGEGAEV